MPRRLVLTGFARGLAQQTPQMLPVSLRKTCQETRECGIAVCQQTFPPVFGFPKARARHSVGTAQFVELGADGLRVEIAHQSADILALAAQCPAAGEAPCDINRFAQRLRQRKLRQLFGRQRRQLFAELLQSFGLAFALRAAWGFRNVVAGFHRGRMRAPEITGKSMRANQGHDTTPAEQAALGDLVRDVLRQARTLGASQVEAGVSVESGLTLTVRLGEVETLEYQRDRGLGVTVYFGQHKGSASSADLSPSAVNETVRAAVSIARHTAEDDCAGLADAELMARDIPDLDLDYPWELSPDAAIEIARRCEDAARAHDRRIENSEGASVTSHRGRRVYANSHGFVGGYASTSHSLTCTVIGKTGDSMQRDYWYTTARDPQELESPEAVGRRAAERTVARLGARKLGTRQAPVLFTPEVARGLVGHFLGAMRGGAQYRQASFLLHAAGQEIFPDFVQFSERPHLKKALASAAFDNEGVATRDAEIVDRGVATAYLLDSYAARKLKLRSTGHAGGVHNLIVTPGALDYAGLLKHMDTGLVVTELMGQGVNGITGDYSRGAAGFWVERGAIVYPVEEITIAGNLKDMYRHIVAIGNDVDLRGSIRTGSILVGEMTIAGE